MKMFIPTIGSMIRLTKDWEFALHHEYRNHDLFEGLGLKWGYSPQSSLPVVLPKGTVLKVSRLYIKGTAREYDSITFWTVASPFPALATKKNGGNGKGRRFWAKLRDVNRIEFEHVDALA